ncbi:twin-arginine translocase TatA/TatE family subunit [Deltaproteobacteria bacterium PRO3]|nr:MAG: twin-arginine translocase TatA/TatE family subunit [bacterium]MCC7344074.1 twin-arginine translocase TatA/TatE family subunit [Deltaproteobacteria bacterium]MDL1870781.1 twin-arginine translocase TatA/TatE family subunit [Deltaproteobacteria bacterium PRO3]
MSLGPGEITALVLVVFLIFGPSKLPGLGRGIGEFFKNFRKEVKDVQRDVEDAKQQLKG